MDDKDNLALWNKVWKTTKDTKTKEVSYGSRKFTAIDAYSQIKTATEQFWKYGKKWGFNNISYEVIAERIYFIWTFYYPDGSFPIFNDQKVWDDAAKKVFTDSLTKALSYLWFNADVFMGQFDGNKYTADKKPKKEDEPVKWYNDFDKNKDKWTDMIADHEATPQSIIELIEGNWYKLSNKTRENILKLK